MGRLFSAVLGVVLLNGCAQLPQPKDAIQITDNSDVESEAQHHLKWVEYADPVADANLAIEKSDFTLLAFSNKGLNFPGIAPEEYELEDLRARCGIKVLKGTGDALRIGDDLEKRKKLRIYAKQYNVLVFTACNNKAT